MESYVALYIYVRQFVVQGTWPEPLTPSSAKVENE
jgi:hypothetical protein